MANRHGLIAGATGTGKTVSVQVLMEGFSSAGVPVFVSDVKGDLSGMAAAGGDKAFLQDRAQLVGLEGYSGRAFPVRLWDVYGEEGIPLRTTLSEVGPLLLGRMLDVNEVQEGVLSVLFRVADEEGMPLLDLKDLRALLSHLSENRSAYSATYGHVAPASIAAIQRRLLQLEDQGGNPFFGEPALDVRSLLEVDANGEGIVNILSADKLIMAPRLYGAFLLWLLSELFEELPEVGDPDKPKLVFVFDEAHLLFDGASRHLLEKVEQVCRLIRSKGVGVFFATQDPGDIPDAVAGQLGTRLQHALRAFTSAQTKNARAAADSFRPNPDFEARSVITELGVGEALVSTLEKKGIPTPVGRTKMRPPSSRLGPLTDAEREKLVSSDPQLERYGQTIDRTSAYEMLAQRTEKMAKGAETRESRKAPTQRSHSNSRRKSAGEKLAGEVARTATRTLMRELMRGILGSLKRR
jgi:DNA helicase HerA-like ATPase